MLPMLRIFRMFLRTRVVCLLHFLLALLFIVPLACAAVAERPLPDPAASANVTAPYPASVSGYGTMASSAAPSIEDVWMQHGGARQYYSAQYSARQQYMGGASRIDPACLPLLPPMKAWGTPVAKKYTKARKPVQAANPCPETDKKTTAAKAVSTGASPSGATGTQEVAKTAQPSTKAEATPEGSAELAAKNKAASAANAADATASTTKAPNGQAIPIPVAPLKVTAPKAEVPQAAIAEKPPLH